MCARKAQRFCKFHYMLACSFSRVHLTHVVSHKSSRCCQINLAAFYIAALQNMKRYVYSKNIIFLEIVEHEIAQTIAKFASNKAFEKNDIFNRIIKLVLLIITLVLK